MAQIVDRLQASGLLKWLGMGAVQTTITTHPEDTADVLFVELGEPREAATVEVQSGICVRIDPESGKVVGLEILGFSRRFGRAPSAANEKFVQELLDEFGPRGEETYRQDLA